MSTTSARNQNYVRQLKGSVLYKIGAILATFLAMPIMIRYLGAERFGIWSTMLTLVTWVMLFDLGIGNGLKNKISENLAKNEEKEVFLYISTSYIVIGAVALVSFCAFFVASFYIPWPAVFNTKVVSTEDLRVSVIVLAIFIFSNFFLSLVNQIYHGLQKSSFVTLGQFFSNGIALALVYLLRLYYDASILGMVLAYGFSLVISNVALSLLIFKSNLNLRPSLKGFDTKKIKSLLSLGVKFFAIQIAVLVIFMTDRIIITQLLGPEQVTPYDVIFKLFSVFTILHGIILTPLWPAYSNAYMKNDFDWIESTLKIQIKLAVVLWGGAAILSLAGPFIVKIWIGDDFFVNKSLYYLFFAFIVVSVWSNVFAYFVNAINRINVQLCTAIVAAIINIPMSIFFVKYLGFGLEGIVLATTLSLTVFALVGPIQVFRIVKKRC